MDIRIDRSNPTPIYRQITAHLREMILSGELPAGFKLPPERHLAAALRLNRTTVLNAYRELKAEGLIGAHVGRGTAVLPRRFTGIDRDDDAAARLPWEQLAGAGASREESSLRDLLEMTERRDMISLSIGLPARELIPLDLVRVVQAKLIDAVGPELLLHSPTEGVTALREAITRFVTARGISCSRAEVLVTSGSQQGLDLVVRALVEPGDLILVEEPTYFGALRVFRSAHARLAGIPMDAEGMRTDVLESHLSRSRPRLIYTLPTFQNPSGTVMSLARRRELLELAVRYQVPVLEDDPYFDLRYDGRPVPPLKALDKHGHVIYLSSFSKALFPGLRLGFLVADRQAVRRLALVKQSVDLHSNTLGQWTIQRFIDDGHYDAHLRRIRDAYRLKRDKMGEALQEESPPAVRWEIPEDGFYYWCSIPAPVQVGKLLAAAAGERVAFLPGSVCFANEPPGNFVRLNFSHPSASEIAAGVASLMKAMRQLMEGTAVSEGEWMETRPIV